MTDLERIKKDVVEMDSRANVCWYDTKVLTKAVRLILEELTADRKTENSSEKPNNSTISKMEQVEDKPQIQLTARCLNCNNAKACKEKHWEGCVYEPKDEKTCETCRHWKYIAHEWQCEACKCQGYEPKDEPQYDAEEVAKDINHRVDMVKKEWNARHIEDEPQTDCPWK